MKYLMATGDYIMLARHAAWRMTKRNAPFLEVTGVITAYFRIADGVERIDYENWFVTRKVCVFLETDREKHDLNVLRMRTLGWQGDDLGTLCRDVALGHRLLRVHCRHVEDGDQIRERWDLRIFGSITGVKDNDRDAENRAISLFAEMPAIEAGGEFSPAPSPASSAA